MILAAVRDTPYNIMLIVHIVTAAVGIAPAFIHPLLTNQMDNDSSRGRMVGLMARNNMRIYGSALVVSGLVGFGLSGMSDDVYPMSDPWISAGMAAWIAMVGILHAMIVPAEKAVADGNDSAEKKLNIGVALFTVLAVVQVIIMVTKPGA